MLGAPGPKESHGRAGGTREAAGWPGSRAVGASSTLGSESTRVSPPPSVVSKARRWGHVSPSRPVAARCGPRDVGTGRGAARRTAVETNRSFGPLPTPGAQWPPFYLRASVAALMFRVVPPWRSASRFRGFW